MEFNERKSTADHADSGSNYEGGEAFTPDDPRERLFRLTINNLLEDTFYRSDTKAQVELSLACAEAVNEDPEFPLRLAGYAREEMFLRQVPQVLLVLASLTPRSQQYVEKYAPVIIQRADEPAEVVAIHNHMRGERSAMPSCLKRGINRALANFDAYQFAKYDNRNRQVNIRDVINRTHPDPTADHFDADHAEIFERLMLGDLDAHPAVDPLEPPETWEVVISEQGNTADAWRSVLDRMGMFARVRNLRNMLSAGIDGEEIFDRDDLEYVERAKLYPFRFYQAYTATRDAGVLDAHTEDWLTDAIDVATGELPDELASTFVGVDLSGSMRDTLSKNSTLTYKELASFFGAALYAKGADVGAFGADFERIRFHRDTPTVEAARLIKRTNVGGSTNGWKVPAHLTDEGDRFDRVVMLTDMQIWDSTRGVGSRSTETVRERFEEYREEVAPEARLYMVDLSSYGDLVTPSGTEGVFNIQGWNEKIIQFIEYAESPDDILADVEAFHPDEVEL